MGKAEGIGQTPSNGGGQGADSAVVRPIGAGLSQKGVRNHNERLLLSLVQRHGAMPGSDLARLAGLTPPAVSAILRSLESDGLIARGDPVRGKVGKPSIPMNLAPAGVLSYGLKIGRRTADLVLLDFAGVIRSQERLTYAYPVPATIFEFIREGLARSRQTLSAAELARVCGIGIAAPFELWHWHDLSGAPRAAYMAWQYIDVHAEVAKLTDLPLSEMNDATAACQAEHVYGRGKEYRDYAYFYVGAFVGGGIVLNHSLYEGRSGNAGALGSLRTMGPNGDSRQLVDTASLHLLEGRLIEAGIEPSGLWLSPDDWSRYARHVEPWIGQTAQELAKASLSTCAVIDFEAILIDGAFPPEIRAQLVERTRRYLATQDTRGLITPVIEEGTVGANARAIGAASGPIFSQYLLNTNAGVMRA